MAVPSCSTAGALKALSYARSASFYIVAALAKCLQASLIIQSQKFYQCRNIRANAGYSMRTCVQDDRSEVLWRQVFS